MRLVALVTAASAIAAQAQSPWEAEGTPGRLVASPGSRLERNVGQTSPDVLFFARTTPAIVLEHSRILLLSDEGDGLGAPTVIRVGREGTPPPTIVATKRLPVECLYYRRIQDSPSTLPPGLPPVHVAPSYGEVRYRDARPGIDVVVTAHPAGIALTLEVSPSATMMDALLEASGALDPERVVFQPHRLGISATYARLLEPPASELVEGVWRHVSLKQEARQEGTRRSLRFSTPRERRRPIVIGPYWIAHSGASALAEVAVDVALSPDGEAVTAGWAISPAVLGNAPERTRPVRDLFVAWPPPARSTRSTLLFYVGGSEDTRGVAAAFGPDGGLWVAGTAWATDLPLHDPMQDTIAGGADAFLAKVTAQGVLAYLTYLGGSGTDQAAAVAVDHRGIVAVAGATDSVHDFPQRYAFRKMARGIDGFVTQVDPVASALYSSTYFGGEGRDVVSGIALDRDGNMAVTGTTDSPDFMLDRPLPRGSRLAGGTDAFVAKLAAGLAWVEHSTLLGGSGDDAGTGVAIACDGSTYVTGWTTSGDFPVAAALQRTLRGDRDAFIVNLSATGEALRYSTYLGGNEAEEGLSVEAGESGVAYVSGRTDSSEWPSRGRRGGADPAFLARIVDGIGALPHIDVFRPLTASGGHGLAVGREQVHVVGPVGSGDPLRLADGDFGALQGDGDPSGRGSDRYTGYYSASVEGGERDGDVQRALREQKRRAEARAPDQEPSAP